MKTLISAVLALTLLGTAGASAQSWRGNGGDRYAQGHSYQTRGYQERGRYDGYRRDDRRGIDNQIGLGLGLFALAAILASQNQPQQAPVYYNGYDGGYYGR